MSQLRGLFGRGGRTDAGVVVGSVLLAAAMRVPFLTSPLASDEGGFLLVARNWQSGPGLYGRLWVDRPPLLIALVRATDALGGVHGIRWVAVVGCAALVLGAAGVALEVARTGAPDARERTVILTVVGTTALVSNPSIDLVAAKGEVLSLPLLVGSAWLVLRALRTRSWPAAAVAGLLAIYAGANLLGAARDRRRTDAENVDSTTV